MIDIHHILHYAFEAQGLIKFGNHYTIISNYLLITLFLGITGLSVKFIMSKTKTTTLSELRSKALGSPKQEDAVTTSDMHREIRELRVKMELMCEEIRQLRIELQDKNPPSYSTYPKASAPIVKWGASMDTYPLPENRLL